MDPIDRKNDIDQWLDEALHEYGKAEPRAGLEGRVLASLQVERTRVTAPRWWWAAGMAAAFVAIAVAVWIWHGSREVRLRETARVTTHREQMGGSIEPGHDPKTTHPSASRSAVATKNSARRPIHNSTLAAVPKLEQFPSRRRLSEVESLLAQRLSQQTIKGAPFEATPTRTEVDLSIGSLEIRPIQIPDIEISESKTD